MASCCSVETENYDVLVIGGGSAAFAAAIKAREQNVSVAVINDGTIGGTCVNVGCIPSKNLLHAAEMVGLARRNAYPGLQVSAEVTDFAALIRQKDEVVGRLRRKKYTNLLDVYGIQLIEGRASFVTPHEVVVGDRMIYGDTVLIATGSRAWAPPMPGLGEVDWLDSTRALNLKELPRRLAVIGGGYIACELGQMFHRFGSEVAILKRRPGLLSEHHEPELGLALQGYFEEEGLAVRTGLEFRRVRQDGGEIVITVGHDGREDEIRCDQLLVAAGRVANTDGLNLDAVGVHTDDRGFVRVDKTGRTSVRHILAAGDVVGDPLLVTIAAQAAQVAVRNALNGRNDEINLSAVPSAVFSDPQVASVGMKEAEARAQGFDVKVARLSFEDVPKAAAIHETRGLIKMVADRTTDRVLGVHIVGPLAADIIHEATLAVRFAMTTQDLIDTVHVYPTMSEAIKMVAQTFDRDVATLSCCAA
ncbi:MAG: mercury(II) reductase [Gemmatimonadetes bacterium]|nr:mercury(II) reductase [Gemmatimonadota bacterium]